MEFVDAEFSYRLESSEWLPSLEHADSLLRDRPDLGAAREMVAGGWMMYGGPNSPMNHIIGMGLRGPVSASELDRVEEFYGARRSICEVVLSPYADPSLMRHLGERGYRITEWNSVLYRRLSSGDRFDSGRIKVEAVGRGESQSWGEVIARGFSDVQQADPEFLAPIVKAKSVTCFMARIDGHPAGGGAVSLFPREGIAALYGAATLPEYRGRGVQNAVFQARLKAARDAGCELAVVCAWPGTASQRNAERNGFRLAYTKAAMQRPV